MCGLGSSCKSLLLMRMSELEMLHLHLVRPMMNNDLFERERIPPKPCPLGTNDEISHEQEVKIIILTSPVML